MKIHAAKIIFVFYITMLLSFSPANAQIIYTDVNPDTSGYCNPFSSCWHEYMFDLNHDGNNDFRIVESAFLISCVINGNTQTWDYFRISTNSLDSNIIAPQDSISPHEFYLGDTIGPQVLWDRYSSLQMVNSIPGVTVCGVPVPGTWNSTGFLGLQLKVGNQNYFGWARVMAYGNTSTDASYTVYDFAYNSTPNQFILAGDTGSGATGLVKNNFSSINLFPNPAIDFFVITLPSSIQKAEVIISDITGKIIYAAETKESQQIKINTKEFTEGIYFVQIQDGDFIISKKLIITK